MRKITAFLCAIFAAALFALTGCSGNENFTGKTYASGDSRVEQIVIEATDRTLEISASEDDQVHIDYYDSEKEYLDVSLDNGTLSVTLILNKNWTDFIGIKPSEQYRKISVKVPNGALIGLSASTTNEDIQITSLSVTERIALRSNGGSIVCEQVSVGKSIDLTAKNGNITGTVCGDRDDFSISCKIKKGNCNLPTSKEGGTKSFTADCNNGNIEIDFIS